MCGIDYSIVGSRLQLARDFTCGAMDGCSTSTMLRFIGRIIIATLLAFTERVCFPSSFAMAHPGRLASLSLLISSLLLLFLFPSTANATALTYNVHANEKACFYLWSDVPGKKVGFYFAVSDPYVKAIREALILTLKR